MSKVTGKSGKPSLCFVSPNAYNVLSGRSDLGHIGGAEVQIVTLARALSNMGFNVSFVTWDHGQPDAEVIDGITIYKSCRRDAGIPVVRFFHPRWSKLIGALKRADADIYLQPCADSVTGQVCRWCNRKGRKFVFVVMHDWDCRADLPKLSTRRERVLYRHGLRHADSIVAQTQRQSDMLKELGLSSTIVYPAGGFSSSTHPAVTYPEGRPRVIWLGRFAKVKRIDWLLEIARRLPDFDFDIVGGANEPGSYERKFIEDAGEIDNMHLLGTMSHAEIYEAYRRSCCHLLSSIDEGFPTVYMESWSLGIPTVTTVDVDRIVERNELGVVCENVDDLVAGLEHVIRDRGRWQEFSDRARAYHGKNHSAEAAAGNLAGVIESL